MRTTITLKSNGAGQSVHSKDSGGYKNSVLDLTQAVRPVFACRGMGGGRGMGSRGRKVGGGRRGPMGFGSNIICGRYSIPAYNGPQNGRIQFTRQPSQERRIPPPVQDIKTKRRPAAIVNQERCKGCNACVDICPMGTIAVQGGKASVDAQNCVGCGACVNICPAGAINLH